jgi:hydroxymethylbilane synthase
MRSIRIATRRSPLALWQAEFVATQLGVLGIPSELVPMTTRGDEILDRSLQAVGGKGLFIKELEVAMQAGQADLAVHSMKDVPAELPDGFVLPAILEREDPRDALVSNKVERFQDLPQGAVLGTSSLRRQAQLLHLRPDLDVRSLRGNVGTRLSKLDAGDYDAIVLAGAGLRRLALEERIAQHLDPDQCLPAAGQGAVGIECREDDAELIALLGRLAHTQTRLTVSAERAVSRALGGSCQVPVAAYAVEVAGLIHLRARVARPDGSELIEHACQAPPDQAESAGTELAEALLAAGGAKILAELETA